MTRRLHSPAALAVFYVLYAVCAQLWRDARAVIGGRT